MDRDAYRSCNRRILSRCAAEKAQRKERQRQQAIDTAIAQTEASHMEREEQAMLQHLAFTEAVDFIQEVVEDVFDSAWHMIRKLRLSRRRLVTHAQTRPTTSSTLPAKDCISPVKVGSSGDNKSGDNKPDFVARPGQRVRWRETLVEARSPDSASISRLGPLWLSILTAR